MTPPPKAPRRRPPWWPADEAWPPDQGWYGPGWGEHGPAAHGWGGRGWEGRRRHGFWWPFGCLILLFVLFLLGMVTVAIWALAAIVGAVSAPAWVVALGVVVLGLIALGVVSAGRGLARWARPIDDLVVAAGRVEGGDYSMRVEERGPRPIRRLVRAFNGMSQRLGSQDKERRTFLADVSHELRTPLTVMQGQLEAISDGVYPADAEHLAPILEGARQLEALIEDVRTVALAEAGALELHRESVDMGALADDVVAGFRAQAEAAGVGLRVTTEPVPHVSVDPGRMRQVLANLLANAVRHTPGGGSVTVAVAREAGAEELRVEVRDTGTGIAPELLPDVFDRFAKGTGSPGSGLGLAIAKDLVAAHGGTIEAVSPPGQGTTIRFTIPTVGQLSPPVGG